METEVFDQPYKKRREVTKTKAEYVPEIGPNPKVENRPRAPKTATPPTRGVGRVCID